MALIATPGAADANSYADVAWLDNYFTSRLHTTAWDALTNEQKEAVAIWSTSNMEAGICWTGSPTTSTQALAWPRTGMTGRNGNVIADNVVPEEVKRAQAEMSLVLAKGDATVPSDIEALGLTKLKAGPVELGFASPSDSGSTLTELVPGNVTALLPASWLCPVDDDSTGKRKIVVVAL